MHERSSKSGLFLMEMIIVIMFFSLASAITVQIFVKSHTISINTVSLSRATQITQNYAEVFRNLNGDFDDTISFLRDDITNVDEHIFTTFFDNNWKPVSSKVSKGYCLIANYSQKDSIHQLSLSVFDNDSDNLIYQVTATKYSGLEVTP